MIWLSWRQLRTQLVAGLAAVAAMATVLVVTGPALHRATRGRTNALDVLTHLDKQLFYAGIVVVAVVPALLGAFWGAPLIARELEAGTTALVWNQGVTRRRWLVTRLGVAALGVAVATGLLTWAVTWWAGPADGALSSTTGSLPSRLTPVSFGMRGVVPIGYAELALLVGVTAGLVLRRTVAAMAVTTAVVAFAQVVVPLWVRPHLMAPVAATVVLTPDHIASFVLHADSGHVEIVARTPHHDDWLLTHTVVDAAGRAAPLPSYMDSCVPVGPGGLTEEQATDQMNGCLARLAADGYRQQITYQPQDRFWSLQLRELGLLLALGGVLTGCCLWRIRRV